MKCQIRVIEYELAFFLFIPDSAPKENIYSRGTGRNSSDGFHICTG
jgi:hypothetical protein